MLGKTVYSDAKAEGKNAIDVSNLSSGIYILSVQSGDGLQNFKFQKN